MLRVLLAVLALGGCSGTLVGGPMSSNDGQPPPDAAGPAAELGPIPDSTPPATADCTGAADFTPCTPVGGGNGTCVAGQCAALAACTPTGCTGPGFQLPDTGLRACLGADGPIACPGQAGGPVCASTAYCGQDAQSGWDADNPASARFAVAGTAGERVIHDTVTGLDWHGCSAGQSGAGCQGSATPMDGFAAEAHCQQSGWGGHDDWRLPDSHELQSIVDYGRTSPAIDLSTFVNTPSGAQQDQTLWWKECYWSATPYASDSDVAWVMMSNSGDIAEGSGTPYHPNDRAAKGWAGCYVRCVRGGARPSVQQLVRVEPVAGEPVVADAVTRLTWQGCSAGQSGAACTGTASMLDWKAALAHCEALSWGGRDDWRLPNVKELRSIVDLTRVRPAVDTSLFPNPPVYVHGTSSPNEGQYWSSTARDYNSFALYVSFDTGFSHFYKQSEGRHVRCVRGP